MRKGEAACQVQRLPTSTISYLSSGPVLGLLPVPFNGIPASKPYKGALRKMWACIRVERSLAPNT